MLKTASNLNGNIIYYIYQVIYRKSGVESFMRKKKIAMKDIADALHVSVNTVSLALNNKNGISEDTRQAIMQKAKELGYTLSAPSLPIRNIALLLNKRYLKSLSFYSRVVYGITNYANQNNFNVIVDFFDNSRPIIPQSIAAGSVEGILTVGNISTEYIKLLNGTNLPLVLIDYTDYTLSTDSVGTQNLQGGYRSTEYLIRKGHRNIGFVGDIHYSNNLRERWLGFCNCIADHQDIQVCQEHRNYSILSAIAPAVIHKDYASLTHLIQSLPKLPTAWICCNDETAVSMYQALDALNICPGRDISIIGFDDVENATLVQPTLTTMHVPKKQMGETAIMRLCSRIEDPSLPLQYITLPVYLVERDSVLNLQ